MENYELNAKLQQKKNALRKELASRGILQKGGDNKFDGYKYFSEAQYKMLFTDLFSKHNLELDSSVDEVVEFTGTQKMPFGRRVKMSFTLTDIETGFQKTTQSSGEGTDKGDKAVYKAMTGALKYFFANTFIVATGDEAEKESDDSTPTHITKQDADIIRAKYGQNLTKLLENRGLVRLEDMSYEDAKELIDELKKIAKQKQVEFNG